MFDSRFALAGILIGMGMGFLFGAAYLSPPSMWPLLFLMTVIAVTLTVMNAKMRTATVREPRPNPLTTSLERGAELRRLANRGVVLVHFYPHDQVIRLNRLNQERGKLAGRAECLFQIDGFGEYGVFMPTNSYKSQDLQILRLEQVVRVDGGRELRYEPIPDAAERDCVAALYKQSFALIARQGKNVD